MNDIYYYMYVYIYIYIYTTMKWGTHDVYILCICIYYYIICLYNISCASLIDRLSVDNVLLEKRT